MNYFTLYFAIGAIIVHNLIDDDELRTCLLPALSLSYAAKMTIGFIAIVFCIAFWPLVFVRISR